MTQHEYFVILFRSFKDAQRDLDTAYNHKQAIEALRYMEKVINSIYEWYYNELISLRQYYVLMDFMNK